jgi:hypothetical protein
MGSLHLLAGLVRSKEKHRFARGERLLFAYNGGEFTPQQAQRVDPKYEADQKLTAIIRQHPGILTIDFFKEVDQLELPRDPARKWLDGAILSGTVRVERGGRNSKKHFLVPTNGEYDPGKKLCKRR